MDVALWEIGHVCIFSEILIVTNGSKICSNYSDAKNMATDVRNILMNIIKTKGNMSDSDAQQYLKKMDAQKRYSADVWS